MPDLITLDTVPSIDRWVYRSIDRSFQSWHLTHDCQRLPVSWVQPFFFICAEKWRSLQSLLPSCRLYAFLPGQPRALLSKAEPTLAFCLNIKVNNINISNTILSKPSQTYSNSHTTSISSSSLEKISKVDSSSHFQSFSTADSVLSPCMEVGNCNKVSFVSCHIIIAMTSDYIFRCFSLLREWRYDIIKHISSRIIYISSADKLNTCTIFHGVVIIKNSLYSFKD